MAKTNERDPTVIHVVLHGGPASKTIKSSPAFDKWAAAANPIGPAPMNGIGSEAYSFILFFIWSRTSTVEQ